jgi:acyl carrier protein
MTEDSREIVAWVSTMLHELQLTTSTEPLDENTGLLGRGIGLDSMEVLQLVVAAEAEFDVTIDESQLKPEYFSTVGAFTTFLKGRIPSS